MVAMTIRRLDEETHRAIKARAKKNGRSAEAEVRAALDEVFRPKERIKVGTEIAKFARKYAKDLGAVDFEVVRDKTPARFVDFSGPEFDFPEPE